MAKRIKVAKRRTGAAAAKPVFASDKPFGGFNDFPPNWKPITTHGFWMMFCMWGVKRTEPRQLRYPFELLERLKAREDRPGAGSVDAILLYTSDEGGLAIVPRRENGNYVQPGYYAFAQCHHLFRPFKSKRKHGATIRTERCERCSKVREIDSSD
jgi:hypothetical protein